MMVRPDSRPRYGVQVPLTSIIDIVFLLLIYFLLTTNFMVDEGITVKLPKAQASAPQVERELVVYVDAAGKTWVDADPVPDASLFTEVKGRLAARTNKAVIIRADRDLVLDNAVHVMDTVKAAGASKLCLATEKGAGQ